MTNSLGRGFFGSIKAQVRYDLARVLKDNPALAAARYPLFRRFVLNRLAPRSIQKPLFIYAFILAVSVILEWQMAVRGIQFKPGYYGDAIKGLMRDVASYYIATQIGILAIVSVAVGVVTLLSQRGDGASINTDIRLYYTESKSYELTVSGVALSIVLVFQLFWPVQHELHAYHLGTDELTFKLCLTFIHTIWLTFNLLLFLQFILITLRFGEPESREILRERYSANDVIPRDVASRLIEAVYLNAPTSLFHQQKNEEPTHALIVFGHGLLAQKDRRSEITSYFRCPVKLADVWLAPLTFALQSWRRRTVKQESKRSESRDILGELALTPSFSRTLSGRCDWVLSSGPTPLLLWERLLIRVSFRFAKVNQDEPQRPEPADFLDLLISKVLVQIDLSSVTGFEATLGEAVRFHSFILEAQNIRGDDGLPMNLAEIGGYFSRPDQEWVYQYRRVYVSAVNKIGSDTSFIERLGSLPARLFPSNIHEFSTRILIEILGLGIFEVAALQDWLTRRTSSPGTDEHRNVVLAGSDKRAYGAVLASFVGSWEYVQSSIISAFDIRVSIQTEPSMRWVVRRNAFPVLERHLVNAAYFLGAAVWNGDTQGEERFRDLLLRWLSPFYEELGDQYRFKYSCLLTPDIIADSWKDAEAAGRLLQHFTGDSCSPETVFGAVLRGLHDDVLTLCAATFLRWHFSKRQLNENTPIAVQNLLKRQVIPGEGTDLTANSSIPPRTPFRMAFDLLLRHGLKSQYGEKNYSAALNDILSAISGVAAPRRISYRVYSGPGMSSVDSLLPQILAILAAWMPTTGDDGAMAVINQLVQNEPFFSDDSRFRDIIFVMTRYRDSLENASSVQEIEQSMAILGFGAEAVTFRLRANDLFRRIVQTLESIRVERLKSAVIDQVKVTTLRKAITRATLEQGPELYLFQDIKISLIESGETNFKTFEAGEIQKGALTTPAMSSSGFDQLEKILVSIFRDWLARLVWQDFYKRPKRVVQVDLIDGEGTHTFWRTLIDDARSVGPQPIVLLRYSPLGEEVFMREYRGDTLPGFSVLREKNIPSGGGVSYIGTVDGVRVYTDNFVENRAILFSAQLLMELRYVMYPMTDLIVDFELLEGADLERCRFRLSAAQTEVWSDDILVEYFINNCPADGTPHIP